LSSKLDRRHILLEHVRCKWPGRRAVPSKTCEAGQRKKPCYGIAGLRHAKVTKSLHQYLLSEHPHQSKVGKLDFDRRSTNTSSGTSMSL
jgi:hypothetical protein